MSAVNGLLSGGTQFLARAGIPSPALDASLLLAETAGLKREQLYAHPELELDEDQSRRYRRFLERRTSGECTAVILGRREFWGLEFYVNSSVLVPRPDTEILVEAALEILRRSPQASVLDLCTGSGVIAVTLKHEYPHLDVWAADLSEAALSAARTNAGRILAGRIRFVKGDLFDALEAAEPPRFFLVTANAPYIPSGEIAALAPEVQHEPVMALDGGVDGLSLIRRIIAGAPQFLEKGGSLVLEADPSQMSRISTLMEAHGFHGQELRRDLAGRNRVILAHI